ncbi:PRKR-interacting protein 1 [Cryptosporidium felis]|nr:PRKR-interacting protein 1 [Cryptosporidium felis]
MTSKLEAKERENQTILLSSGKEVEIEVKIRAPEDQDELDQENVMFERIRNVGSCSAAAGSNFFHSYRKMKKIEEERLNKMEEDYQKEKEKKEFNDLRKARIMSCIQSTSRKAEKRKKKKLQRHLKNNTNSSK